MEGNSVICDVLAAVNIWFRGCFVQFVLSMSIGVCCMHREVAECP